MLTKLDVVKTVFAFLYDTLLYICILIHPKRLLHRLTLSGHSNLKRRNRELSKVYPSRFEATLYPKVLT